MAPSRLELTAQRMKRLRKAVNAARRHLAGGHCKLSMAHPATAHRMTIDSNIVGWVRDHHLSELALQQTFVSLAVLGIAAGQAMPAELPNITNLRNRRSFRSKTRQIIGRISRRGSLRAVYHQVDFPGRKASELNVEIEFDQILEIASQ